VLPRILVKISFRLVTRVFSSIISIVHFSVVRQSKPLTQMNFILSAR
jgi:hypothetical protein